MSHAHLGAPVDSLQVGRELIESRERANLGELPCAAGSRDSQGRRPIMRCRRSIGNRRRPPHRTQARLAAVRGAHSDTSPRPRPADLCESLFRSRPLSAARPLPVGTGCGSERTTCSISFAFAHPAYTFPDRLQQHKQGDTHTSQTERQPELFRLRVLMLLRFMRGCRFEHRGSPVQGADA